MQANETVSFAFLIPMAHLVYSVLEALPVAIGVLGRARLAVQK